MATDSDTLESGRGVYLLEKTQPSYIYTTYTLANPKMNKHSPMVNRVYYTEYFRSPPYF